ncbi:MAG: LysM peptidoglycan-binding domain-containing protein, partial [Anaerolineae bacterium]|nr:LysM peptidoglycan-binding domain-containing protein [Anaerolineae bacterium]
IYVRPPDGATLPPPGPETHTVQEGQSAWAIAARYNLTLDELLNLNGLPPGVILQPGEQIIIRLAPGQEPPPTRTPTPMPTTHRVQAGDSLWSIAIRYNLEIDELLDLNGLVMESVIVPGDELVIRRVEPTLTPSETPRPSPTPTATAATTAAATAAAPVALAPAVTAVSGQPTDLPSITPSVTLTPSQTPRATLPVPTETPTPAGGSRRVSNLLIGAVVIGLGVLVLIGMLGVELYERLSR